MLWGPYINEEAWRWEMSRVWETTRVVRQLQMASDFTQRAMRILEPDKGNLAHKLMPSHKTTIRSRWLLRWSSLSLILPCILLLIKKLSQSVCGRADGILTSCLSWRTSFRVDAAILAQEQGLPPGPRHRQAPRTASLKPQGPPVTECYQESRCLNHI